MSPSRIGFKMASMEKAKLKIIMGLSPEGRSIASNRVGTNTFLTRVMLDVITAHKPKTSKNFVQDVIKNIEDQVQGIRRWDVKELSA